MVNKMLLAVERFEIANNAFLVERARTKNKTRSRDGPRTS